jgi:hypothetical protein
VSQLVTLDPQKYPCRCVKSHRPRCRITEAHHVWPLYLGGPENGLKVPLCPTAHDIVHGFIRLILAGKKPPAHANSYLWHLALQGVELSRNGRSK